MAIFIIVILALLGTSMVRLITTGAQSISQEITSLKAYLAAQSGLQWGMYQAVYSGATGTHTVDFTNAGLANTQSAVTLQSAAIAGKTVYQIESDGEYGNAGDREYSRRQLELRMRP